MKRTLLSFALCMIPGICVADLVFTAVIRTVVTPDGQGVDGRTPTFRDWAINLPREYTITVDPIRVLSNPANASLPESIRCQLQNASDYEGGPYPLFYTRPTGRPPRFYDVPGYRTTYQPGDFIIVEVKEDVEAQLIRKEVYGLTTEPPFSWTDRDAERFLPSLTQIDADARDAPVGLPFYYMYEDSDGTSYYAPDFWIDTILSRTQDGWFWVDVNQGPYSPGNKEPLWFHPGNGGLWMLTETQEWFWVPETASSWIYSYTDGWAYVAEREYWFYPFHERDREVPLSYRGELFWIYLWDKAEWKMLFP